MPQGNQSRPRNLPRKPAPRGGNTEAGQKEAPTCTTTNKKATKKSEASINNNTMFCDTIGGLRSDTCSFNNAQRQTNIYYITGDGHSLYASGWFTELCAHLPLNAMTSTSNLYSQPWRLPIPWLTCFPLYPLANNRSADNPKFFNQRTQSPLRSHQ